MDEFIKNRFLKTGELSIHDLEDPKEIHSRVREATSLLGIHGMGIRMQIDGVAGPIDCRFFTPFDWHYSGARPEEDAVRCVGYTLVAFEVFTTEGDYLLYFDCPADRGGQYRRFDIQEGALIEVCRSGLLGEGDLVGHKDDPVRPAHPLSRVLGEPLQWFIQIGGGGSALLGFGTRYFNGASGEFNDEGEELLQHWRKAFEEWLKSDVHCRAWLSIP